MYSLDLVSSAAISYMYVFHDRCSKDTLHVAGGPWVRRKRICSWRGGLPAADALFVW